MIKSMPFKYWLPKSVIQRYLASNFVGPFVMSTLFFVIFLLTFQLFRLIRIVTDKDVDPMVLFELMGHIAISFLPMAIPLAALFASVYTLNKLSEDSEVVAMRSFGLKKETLIVPFVVLGFFIAGSIFALNRNLIPHSKTQFKNTFITLSSQGNVTNIKAGQFFIEIPGITLFSETVSDDGNHLGEVFIFQKKNDQEEQVIVAKRGALIKQSMGELRAPTLRLHLEEGNILKLASEGKTEKILFQEYDFPVVDGGGLPGIVTKDSMRSNQELKQVIEERREEFNKLSSKKNLTQEESRNLGYLKNDLPKSELEYWGRFNTPLQVILFIFLGFSIGIKKGRGRTKSSGSMGLVFLIGDYILFFGGISLARKGSIPASFAVFTPSVLSAFLGVYLFKKLDWQS